MARVEALGYPTQSPLSADLIGCQHADTKNSIYQSMIRYALACNKAHPFESWFPSSEAYDAQRLLACPISLGL